MTTYPCGCVNATDEASGVLRSISKCDRHKSRQRDPATLDASYYEELGIVRDGKPLPTNHVAELTEALGPIPQASKLGGLATEFGCGASPYVAEILAAGYQYLGVDASEWATGWICENYGINARTAKVEDSFLSIPIDSFILAAHVLEHLDDAPGAIVGMTGMLASGGELWIIVPDDSDPVNPDHLWFFTEATLRACVERAGMIVVKTAVRRHVSHENFIYLRASKA